MSDRQKWSRLVASIFALTLVSAFAFATIAPRSLTSLFTAEATEVETAIQPAPTPPEGEEELGTVSCTTVGPIEVQSTGGTITPTAYATLGAAFTAVNAGTHTGSISVEVCASTIEGTTPATLNSTGSGTASYTSLNMYPVVNGVSISGNPAGGFGVIQLNGADNVTIDGDNPNLGGTTRSLSVANTATAATTAGSVVRIATSATAPFESNNNITIKNLNLDGNVTGGNASTLTSTTGSSNSSFGIIVGPNGGTSVTAVTSVTGATAAGVTVNSLSIDNNAVNQTARGIAFIGGTSASSTGVTITNNVVGAAGALAGAAPYTTPATTVYTKGIYVQGTNAITISGNTVRNILSYVATAMTGIELNAGIGSGTINISNNTVTGVVLNVAAGNTARGISVVQAGGPYTISGNTVSNIQNFCNSTTITNQPNGIFAGTTAASAVIERNRVSMVYDRNPGTFGVAGVFLNGGNNIIVRNNFIWDVNQDWSGGAAFSTTFGAFGLRIAAGTGHQIYHNSINLYGPTQGTSNSALLSSAFALTATTLTGVDVRNNIFSNTLTGGTTSIAHTSMFLPSGATVAMNLTLNNNDYFSGADAARQGIAQVGTTAGTGFYLASNFDASTNTPATNLRAYTSTLNAAGTNDNATKVVNPLFLNDADLHILGASPMVDMAVTVAVSNDIDNESRPNGAGSDIGADEFFPSPGALQLSSSSYVGNEGANATITVNRVSGSTGAVGATITLADGTAVGGASCGAGVDYVNPGPQLVNFGDGVTTQNVVVSLCNDGVLLDPAETFTATLSTPTGGATLGSPTVASVTITNVAPPFVGAVSVGSAETYTSLTNPGGLFEAINTSGVSGNITIGLTSDLTGESGTVALNEVAAGFTVTIKPSGAARSITSTASAIAVIKLNDADNVTIDGSLSGGSDRSLSITNTNPAASTAVIWLGSATNGAESNTIKNVNLAGGTDQNVANVFNFGIIASSSGTILTGGTDLDNNTYTNNFIRKVNVGIISIGGLAANMNQNTTISNNSIGPVAFGSDQIGTLGILIFNENAPQITGNELQFIGSNLVTGGAAARDHVGISMCTGAAAWLGTSSTAVVGTVTNANISRNRIHDVVERGTFSAVGIHENCANAGNPTANNIANNMIYGIQANGTSGDQGVGIGITNGNGDNIVFNSINLTGDIDPGAAATSSTPTFGISVVGTLATNLNLKDNISVIDVSSNTATLFHAAINLTSPTYAFGTGGSNYNDLYAPAANLQSRTGATANGGVYYSGLAAWQTATTQDANSKEVDPVFVSATNLHLQGTSTLIGMATPIAAVTTDFDSDLRNPTTPDIGVDEFAAYVLPTVQFTSPTYVGAEGSTVTVTVTRTGDTTIASAVNFATSDGTAVGGASCAPSVDYVANSGSLNFAAADTSKTFTVQLCTDAVPKGSETVNLTLSAPTGATLGTPSASVLTITNVSPPVTGAVSVGTGQTYTSLTNPGGIFEAINLSGAAGPVTINVVSDLAGETGAVALNEIASGSPVLIKPSGAARVISGTSTTLGLIKLNGADNITIDGSLAGGTDQSLTIRNGNLGATVIWIASASASNAANTNTIKNLNLSSNVAGPIIAGILAGSGTTFGNDAEIGAANNSILHNSISRVQNALFIRGNSLAMDQNWVIQNNTFGSAVAADKLLFRGMLIGNSQNFNISNNVIRGISSTTTTSSTMSGIVTALAINGGTIAKNSISDIRHNNTAGWGSNAIYLTSGSIAQNLQIENNFISDIASAGFNGVADTDNGYGIAMTAGSGIRLYYNSISLNTNQIAAVGITAAINITAGVTMAGAVDMRDNILLNQQTVGTRYAVIDKATVGTLVFSSINYNDYFAQNVGLTATAQATLANWQTATSQDANSQAVDPLFISTTNLHLQNASPVLDDGTPIAGITTDIDGETRSASTPDIGADEVATVLPGALAFSSATYAVSETGPTVTLTVNRTGGSDGAVNVDYAFGGGTATGGAACGGAVDYVNAGGTLMFANAETTKNIVVPVCEDIVFEGDETFNATLSNATGGATIGSPNPATVTITENKGAPTVQFSSATYTTLDELSGGGFITITLSGPSQSNVTVNYATVAGGTATGGASCTAGVDYINTANGATIVAGQTSVSFFVPTCFDSVDEPDETVNLALTSPVGATLGTPNTAVLTIIDNDLPASPITVTATAGTVGPTPYNTLKEAIDAINAGTHQGGIAVSVNANTTETATSVLNGSGAGAASYTSILIRPTVDGLTIAGPSVIGRGLIELNGADNVTIDGDNPNSAGTNRNLTIQNTAANTINFTSVIRIAVAATLVNSADNDVIRNLNILGSATGRNIAAATSTTGTENTTFGVFFGPGASTTDATAAPAAVTSVLTGVAAGATANNLAVNGNNVRTAGRGISINGSATSNLPGLLVNGNSIGNPVAGDPDQVTAIGIAVGGSTNAVISGNTVWQEGYVGSSSAGQAINVGVNSANITGATIEKNRINRARSNNGATWSEYGIHLGGGNNHIVQNNFVSGVINSQTAGTGAFGITFGAFGIRVASGTGHKVYHNSVHLYDAMPGTTSTNITAALLVVAATQTGVDIRNNIFSNQVVGGNPTGTRNVAVYLPSAATVAMNLTFNNNSYFVGTDAQNRLAQVGSTFGTGEYQATDFDPTSTTPAANLRAYTSPLSAAGTNDNASFASTATPPFTSNFDLHIPAATATRLESGGAAVGVTVDIDAEARNATTPDIGADEFAGTPAPANDIAAAAIINPAPGSNVSTGAVFTPQARFLNNGTAAQTNVPVRFRIVNSSMVEVYNQVAMIASIAPLQQVVVSFPATSIGVAGAYTTFASSELVGDSNTSNDSITAGFNALVPIAGTVSVGTGETYTSLTNPGGVFEAINAAGIVGAVTVNITSDLTAETGVVPLNQFNAGASLTIKPSGAARTVSGTAASLSMIKLNGADNVTIDGSLSGGTDRSLSLLYTNTGGTVVWIAAQNASNGASNNTIKNCIIASNPGTLSVAGVLGGSGTTLGGAAEAPNNNNTLQNNEIFRVQNSLYNQGNAGLDQNWTITGNLIGKSSVGDRNAFRGMLIGNAQNLVITNNTIQGVSIASTTAGNHASGLQIAFTVNGGTITNNRISDIRQTGTQGSYGIHISGTTPLANVTIANNFVWDIAAVGSATLALNGHGIIFNGTTNVTAFKVYHNSVNMNATQASGTMAALQVTGPTVAGALDVRNNIFVNPALGGATRYAVHSASAASVYSPIDYNDYFAQNVGFIGGSARVTLADWQTATTQDANSKSVDPLFVSGTDLHLQAASTLINMGVAGTGITTDIDGQARDATPDIGADEVPAPLVPGSLQFSSPTYSVSENGGTATITVTRTGGSDGTVTAQYASTNGSATGGASCGAGIDYVFANGTVTFLNTETSKTFDVTICNDAAFEPGETVNLALSNPTGGATIGSPSAAVLTITNDDPTPGSFSINDVRRFEGDSGKVVMMFTVTYSGSVSPASVQYSTANGTAIAGVDYNMASGTLFFGAPPVGPEGTPSQTQNVIVTLIPELVKEANETFFVNLSAPTNGTIADGQGVGIIIDEDRAYVDDFDRDLIADFSIFRPSMGFWYVLQSTNLTPKINPLGTTGDAPVPGDYDGDGLTDYAVFRPSTGVWFVLNSSNSTLSVTSWGTTGDKQVQGDYDGDGKTDRAIYRPSTGYWWVIKSSDGTTNSVPFGISTDRPVQGDYDGDFRTDLAVYRDGLWYISRSSDGAVQIASFGLATDKPVSGDFDGDGKNDLAVYRDGVWWIMSSLSGTATAVPYGTTGDIPVPADYDADGTTDRAVFRPSTGDWYVLRSSDNVSTGVNWGSSGDIPIPAAYLPQ